MALRGRLSVARIVVPMMLMVAVGVSGVAAQAKVALVIGNGDYSSLSRLNNPPNDARDVAAALRRIGFEVEELVDANQEQMEAAVVRLGQRLARSTGATGFFFYAGHGVESGGENYLIPARASIPSESFLRSRAIPSQAVLDEMQRAGAALTVVVLDACRDNPFSWSRSGARGLAAVTRQPPGSIIAYATSAGDVASDGTGRNGIFTTELLRHLTTPGIDVAEVFRRTGQGVRSATNSRQIPAVYSQFFDTAFLAGPAGGAATAETDPAAPSFGPVTVATGSISISVTTAATVTLLGQSVQLPAGGTLPVDNVAVGTVPIQVRYANGHTESRSVTVNAGQGASTAFSYRPPAPAPNPAPAVQPAAVPQQPVRESIPTILVQGGTFRMGSANGGDSDERPVHEVTVSSFRMARTETTFDQYDAFARATGRELPNDYGWGRGTRPVINVSWYDAVAFSNWLSRQDGLTPAYTISGTNVTWNRSANGWRLPTEAEWEFAARGGTQSRNYTYAGGNDVGTVAWYGSNSGSRTQPVGGKRANELGLQDMSGNVWEWCWDWYGAYPSSVQTDPAGPASGSRRLLRGGSENNSASDLRSASRASGTRGDRSYSSGFRLVRSAVR